MSEADEMLAKLKDGAARRAEIRAAVDNEVSSMLAEMQGNSIVSMAAENVRLRALLEEARRVVFFSAKDLRRIEGEDSVLCELVEEEQFVKDATDVLGPMPEVYR